MKRLIHFAVLAAILPLLFACGSSKKVSQTVTETSKPVETPKSSSQIVRDYAEAAPKGVLRGFGTYEDTEEWFAYKAASAIARSDIAATVAGKVTSAIKLYKGKYGAESYNAEKTERSDKDAEKRDEGEIKEIAEEILQGARVVKSLVDKNPNGTYTVYCCVEVDSETLANYISGNSRIKSLVSEEEKMTIDFHRQEFENSLREEFDKFKQERGR
ncbi:MAG: hypothetical protein ACI39U_00860 [Candidatus Cryptobacteroides sp.]